MLVAMHRLLPVCFGKRTSEQVTLPVTVANSPNRRILVSNWPERGSNPHSNLTQPIFCLAVARFANSAALHGRCIFVALNGSKWRRMTLICNGSSLPGASCPRRYGQQSWSWLAQFSHRWKACPRQSSIAGPSSIMWPGDLPASAGKSSKGACARKNGRMPIGSFSKSSGKNFPD